MPFTAEILSESPERNKTRVTFQFRDGEKILGPYVEDRPVKEDYQALFNARIPQPPAPDVEVGKQEALDTSLGAGTYDALRKAMEKENPTEFVDAVKLAIQREKR